METSAGSSDAQRELRELRARAYGPGADIDLDPVALARLADLESRERQAHASLEALQEAPEGTRVSSTTRHHPSSAHLLHDTTVPIAAASSPIAVGDDSRHGAFRQWTLTTRGGRLLLAVAAGATVVALVYGANWLMTPRPAATLMATGAAGAATPGEAGRDRWVVVSSEDELFADLTIDRRTLTPFGTFRGVEAWTADDELGNACLILIEESTQRTLQGVCTPRSGELIADVGAWPGLDHDFAEELVPGTVLRFQHQGTTIDAFVIHPSGAR